MFKPGKHLIKIIRFIHGEIKFVLAPCKAGFHHEVISPIKDGFHPSARTDLVEKSTSEEVLFSGASVDNGFNF